MPLLNTLILLTSGVTATWAHHALLHDNRRGIVMGLVLTVILGFIFTGFQAYEYSEAAFSYAGHIYGSTFFMATGFHGAHVIIGTIFLLVCLIRALSGAFTPKAHFGFEPRPGTGTSSTWSGCSCLPASMSGVRVRTRAAALTARRIAGSITSGAASCRPVLLLACCGAIYHPMMPADAQVVTARPLKSEPTGVRST